ncbi:MAG: molybdopterin converting factor subunit 1 [Chloroflexaceae bacterium]|nr:molybdopterin converting factor subunit 1 [Chloroflexaceae bacterium]
MITVRVRLFAAHRDIVGRPEVTLQMEPGATVGAVWEQLVAGYPSLGRYTGRLLYAVNQQFAEPDASVDDGDEVAIIPPVSGGVDRR